MSQKRIRQLFESRLSAWAVAEGYPVAYQNQDFTPPENGIYLRAYLLPAPTGSDTLAGDHRRYQGVFQISVVVPTGQGAGQAEDIVGELADLFPLYDRLTRDAFTVVITTPVSQGPEVPEASTFTLPASFSYRADTN
ncbi:MULTISPECIES: DUF4128 domain-containing protein [unclassified Pseudomonas]|jgi:hypothetical protein|uniref:DUF4128 domain-containing protein n=1 Tax=unclassified Pseudomonas TaxID=196821 RepID=UPI00236164D2|nr:MULTISPECIES: DUF4128 domain-containing protein [unclassified Pseudomonas]